MDKTHRYQKMEAFKWNNSQFEIDKENWSLQITVLFNKVRVFSYNKCDYLALNNILETLDLKKFTSSEVF